QHHQQRHRHPHRREDDVEGQRERHLAAREVNVAHASPRAVGKSRTGGAQRLESPPMLDVRGDDEACAVLIGGRLVALHWSDGQGRCGGQHLWRGTDTGALATRLAKLPAQLDAAAPLARQLAPLMDLLVDGDYRITWQPAQRLKDLLEWEDAVAD